MAGIGDDESTDGAAHNGQEFVRRGLHNRAEFTARQHIAAERTADNNKETNNFHDRPKEILSLTLKQRDESLRIVV